MTEIPRYCTHCGAGLVSRKGESSKFSPKTGRKVQAVFLVCPNAWQSSFSELAIHDSFEIPEEE